jgi:DNA-binding PadR family transcriptional regulator
MAERPLTDFEHVLLGIIAAQPQSGYQLRKYFTDTPAAVYQPSPGALYPALRRLRARGLLASERVVSAGRRRRELYQLTAPGRRAHLDWLRQPVDFDTVGRDLGLHLMRFVMMEDMQSREETLGFLADLAAALDQFIADMEHFAGSLSRSASHGALAMRHGIAVHRASRRWAHATLDTLRAAPGTPRNLP